MTQESQLVVPTVIEAVWRAFGDRHASRVMDAMSKLSRNPFLWNSVVRGLSHGSTWPGTAQAYRLLLGAVLLGEEDFFSNEVCDSQCEFCGAESIFQVGLRAFHTALNYPKPPVSSAHKSSGGTFILLFARFLCDLTLSPDSPYAEQLGQLFRELGKQAGCPISLFPSVFTIFKKGDDSNAYFFSKLSNHFSATDNTGRKKNSGLPSVSSFILMLGAKAFEAATVESGRNFDKIMLECVEKFAKSLPEPHIPQISSQTKLLPLMVNPGLLASSMVQIIRHSLVTVLLPPTEWIITPDPNLRMEQLLKSEKPVLERCTQFMEPSAVLSVIKYMLTRPEAVPNLSGNNEGKFNYFIGKINFLSFDIDRSLCIIKSLKTSSNTPLPASAGAKLALIVKEVNLQLEHEWKIDWNTRKYTSFFGKNVVTVKGLSCQVHFTVFPDDQGPVIESAKISLGVVEHSCTILNSNFISGILAQAALDWFAEPLTRLLQTASQSAIEEFLKSANAKFRLETWNQVILKIVPSQVLAEVLQALNDHLPRHGVPI
jgi:hypothetical protein